MTIPSMESNAPMPVTALRAVIASNGFADGPAQALRDFLLMQSAAEVWTILHPLVDEGDVRHQIILYKQGQKVSVRSLSLPFRPPFTYPLDAFVPLRVPAADIWFGFNNLASLRGLWEKKRGKVDKVVYWCVDFVPNRFGHGFATKAYDALDAYVCRRVTARFELSQAARSGREARHHLPPNKLAPSRVVPMGAWLDRVPITATSAIDERRVLFFGHLVPRQGVDLFVEAIKILVNQRIHVKAEIVGRGPLLDKLRDRSARLGLQDIVTFHGFIDDHREVEEQLAKASIAVAPYAPGSFTQYADPGKLKAYLAAGLPVILTPVPPNAQQLADQAGAMLIEHSAESLAEAIARLFQDREEWRKRREAALRFVKQFDWNHILPEAFSSLEIETA